MDILKAFPSRYLCCDDLQGNAVEAVIATVTIESIGDDVVKPVIHFIGAKKGLVLNKTNALAIAATYGNETDDWLQRPIVLFPTTTPFRGIDVACIRVRVNPQPPQTKAAHDVTTTSPPHLDPQPMPAVQQITPIAQTVAHTVVQTDTPF